VSHLLSIHFVHRIEPTQEVMNTRSRWLVTIGAIGIFIAALAGFKFFQIKATIEAGQSRPERSVTVEATTARTGEFVTTTTVLGEVVSPQFIALRNELEGRITAVNFASGDQVKKGDVLVQLDISEESARLQAARARAKLAKLDLERFENLYTKKTVSQQQVDKAQAEYDVARAEVRALEATIDKKTLRAPFDAIAGLHALESGEYIDGNAHIVDLVGTQNYLWVDFSLPMGQTHIGIGQEVSITLMQDSRAPLTGNIVATESRASASSRNLRYRARVETEDFIPANTVVRVTIPIASSVDVIVPTTALLKDSMGDYVYFLTPNESGDGYRANRRGVTIGKRNADLATIVSGLRAGDLVADNGGFKLNEGLLTYVARDFIPSSGTEKPAADREP
jgi:membrane fusion protein, multidrug efflux system